MEAINIIDPNTGQAHAIPYDQLPNALKAGGQFADEEQKQKAISLQNPSKQSENKPEVGSEEFRDEGIRKETGFKGLAAETLLNLSNAMKSSVLFGRDLPKMIKQSAEAEKERPLRPYVATAGGLAEIGKGVINAPYDLNQLLSRKFKSFPNGKGILPHIPEDTGVASVFGLDKEQPEDRLYKGLANVIGAAGGSEFKALKGIEGGKLPPKVMPKHIEAQIDKEKSVLAQSKKRMEQFKEKLESHPDYGTAKPSTLLRKSAELGRKVEEELPNTLIEEKPVPKAPPKPDTAKMNRMAAAEETNAKEGLSKALKEGTPHHIEGAKILEEEIGQVKNAASNQFNETRAYFGDKEIPIDKSQEVKAVKDKISELQDADEWLPGYAHDTPEIKALQSQLDRLSEPEFVKAGDVLDVYQTLQKIAKRTNDEIYERGSRLTEVERKEKKAQAQKYMKLSDELGDILEKVGDKNGIEMLKNARASWREYASLYGNPIFQSLEKHHALPVDTISKLDVGTSGNELLNRIVAKRPDLRENIFAQKYSSPKSHGELLRPSKLNDKYLKELPDVKSFVESLKNAAENKKEVKATGFELKAEHKELADAISKEAERQKLRQEAVANVKNYRELAAKKTKAAELVKKKVSQAKARGENIDALQAQLDDLLSQKAKLKRLLNTALKAVYRYGGIKSALGH